MPWTNVSGLKATFPFSEEEIRLTNDRWRLRDEITRIMRDTKRGTELQAFISSYNEVVELLHGLEVGPRVDPMDKLPSEIITNIMLEVSTYTTSWYISRFMDSLIDLTLVSKRWRSFILSEPLLWNGISLDSNPKVCAITSMQLALSKDLPLTLQIHLPFKQWNSIHSDLMNHRDRIEAIVLFSPYSSDNSGEKAKDIRKILEDLGPLPSLRQLGGSYQPYGEIYDVPWIIDHCQSLKEIINLPILAQDLRAAKSRLIFQELTTYDRIEHVLPVAETIKELRKVVFLPGTPTFSLDDVGTIHPQQVPLSTHPLGWTHLTYDLYSSQIPKSLLHRLPSLVTLEIYANLHILQYLVSIADQFPKLCRFRAMTPLTIQEEIIFPDNVCPNFNVDRLELYIFCQGYYGFPPQDNPEYDRLCQSVHIVPEMLLHAMPKAQYLHLSITGMLSEFPFFSLDDWFTGEEIDLSFSDCGVMPNPDSCIPTSVERLSVACSRAVTCSLSSKSLTNLTIQGDHRMEKRSEASSSALATLDLDAWPSLEAITIYDNWITWSKHSLTYLKRVYIQKRYGKPNLGNDVTSFVRDIACSPESYPSLEELVFGECPEWDIFIIMLERRNLRASRGVARINRVMIQSSCSPHLYHVISQLVLGRWTERPSNKELSMAGNAKRILDLSLPGCYSCHKALRQCETPVKANWVPEPDYNENVFLTMLQEYSESEDDILNTWEERAQLWESWNKGKRGRELTCGR
ncbi:hypothetical protein CPB86DRAFT_766018 [Serendipita vermifera]|nr:hypothetical protein CPB86DRAFT_766018 [Serendipita vermifera]